MKKIILTLAVAVTLGTSAFAVGKDDKSKSANVSYQVQNQFNAQFNGAENVVWSATSVGQKAEFVLDDVKMAAFYNTNGDFIGSTESITFKQLPSAAKKEISAKYPGYFVGEVLEYQSGQSSTALDRLTAGEDDSYAYFVDLKNDQEEFLLRVTPHGSVYFYKQIK